MPWDPTGALSALSELLRWAQDRRDRSAEQVIEMLLTLIDKMPPWAAVLDDMYESIQASDATPASVDDLEAWPPYASLESCVRDLTPTLFRGRVAMPGELDTEFANLVESIESSTEIVRTYFQALRVNPDLAADYEIRDLARRGVDYLQRLSDASIPYLRRQLRVR